jgi:hypothetical protein
MVPEDMVETNSLDTAFLYRTGQDDNNHQNHSDNAGHRMSDPP